MSIRTLFAKLKRPSSTYSLGALVITGIAIGVAGVPTFTYVIDETSTDAFCLTCHDQDIGLEMAGRVHYDNATGVRASCSDCHLPHAFWPKVMTKTKSGVKDVYHTMLGTISTPEKFEARRMHMAMTTWAAMNANDSRECRHCHDEDAWVLERQSEKARRYHGPALSRGKTCIDCHKGLAHELPQGIGEDHQIEGLDY
ncbi:MAG: Denitrification system component NirT [Gammaproteobacteria bacterium]|nr:Denitrification system component NirT [Gammaproteobacteria bacterium]NIV51021.1 Denitrification system component NirT [Gammaproteobacteria bacterium]NIX84943.1 Denitrification system component NirT [Gammaproteobacteria bacterium]